MDATQGARSPLKLLLAVVETLASPTAKTPLESAALARVALAAARAVGPAVLRRIWSPLSAALLAQLDTASAEAVLVHTLACLATVCAAMDPLHWGGVDHCNVLLRALAFALHPHPPAVREAAHQFAAVALAPFTSSAASPLHGAVVQWALHVLTTKQQV